MNMFLNYDSIPRILKRITKPEEVARIAKLTDHFLTRLAENGPDDNLSMYRYNSTLDLYQQARKKIGEKELNEWLGKSASNNEYEKYMVNIEPKPKHFRK